MIHNTANHMAKIIRVQYKQTGKSKAHEKKNMMLNTRKSYTCNT